jgi:hypothetical protein
MSIKVTPTEEMSRNLDMNGRQLEYANRYDPIQDPRSPNI